MRDYTIEKILENKVIAIIRGQAPDVCINIARALHAGGVNLIEVTFNQAHPETFEDTANAIAAITKEFDGEVLAGAGTVTSPELVEMAAEAGAKYIISPDTNVDVIKRTRELGLVSIPGALTPSEITLAHRTGADFIKLFPAADMGLSYLKSIRAPLNHIKFLATGGINEKNIGDYIKAGAVGAGCGGNLVNKEHIAAGNYEKLTEAAREFMAAAK